MNVRIVLVSQPTRLYQTTLVAEGKRDIDH